MIEDDKEYQVAAYLENEAAQLLRHSRAHDLLAPRLLDHRGGRRAAAREGLELAGIADHYSEIIAGEMRPREYQHFFNMKEHSYSTYRSAQNVFSLEDQIDTAQGAGLAFRNPSADEAKPVTAPRLFVLRIGRLMGEPSSRSQ